MRGNLTRDEYAACVGSSFRLCPDHPESFDLLLVEVSELKTTPGQEAFSLFFRGPADRLFSQATYPLAHETLGIMDIFMVPVKQDQSGIFYEALFNRLVQK